MESTIKTPLNFNNIISQQCTSLHQYKISKDFKTMAENQAKIYSQKIVNTMNQSIPIK